MAFTAENVRELLSYDPETGVFTWLTTASNRRKQGQIAGCICKRGGYVLIGYKGRIYGAHRLAWLYVHGSWPDRYIDHVNGNPTDNRIANLRLATPAENQRNRRRQNNNTSGYKGVHRHQGMWRARIAVNGRHISLGLYHNPEDAHRAYAIAAERYHGEFARAK